MLVSMRDDLPKIRPSKTKANSQAGNHQMKEIHIGKGIYTRVDDEDFEYLNTFKWHNENRYPGRYVKPDDKNRHRIMSRMILNAPKDRFVDHADGNPLNNQKFNLRLCDRVQNSRNQKLRHNKIIPLKGVAQYIRNGKYENRWRARIRVDKKLIHLGYFSSPEMAHDAYKIAAVNFFGEFARFQ